MVLATLRKEFNELRKYDASYMRVHVVSCGGGLSRRTRDISSGSESGPFAKDVKRSVEGSLRQMYCVGEGVATAIAC